ncbi:MAG: endonuclease/exonuclease/phosphatase family protein [Myxococcales bacterium]|nr:endonuclease/exonuclease/phosphatase family protein [Myxococcales bacterium]MCB9578641.1 endonuclease/exonuclease/phosphatase family protein [Polyangiaceae bacterium]
MRSTLLLLSLLLAQACQPAPSSGRTGAPPQDAAASSDAGTDGQSAATTLRVATFNVHLFFDPTCDSGSCGPGDFEQAPSQTAFDSRAEAIANAIRSLDADVISLQELETQVSMEALSSRLKDLYPTTVFVETGAPGSMDVAVFGKGKLLEARKHRDMPLKRPDGSSTTFSREFLEVHQQIGGRRVIAFAAHFRSKNNDDPGRRLAEAQAAHDIVVASTQEFPDAVVVLAGDLNDTPGSPPISALESGNVLLRAASDLPLAEQYTYQWNGHGEAIDHVYLATSAQGAYVPSSAKVVHDPSGWGLAASDHAAVTADFALSP